MVWFWILALGLAAAAGGWMIRPLIIPAAGPEGQSPMGAQSSPSAKARRLALAVMAVIPLAALGLYLAIGRPEFATGALMKAQRETRAFVRLVDTLKAEVARRPDDGTGHRLLATSLAQLGRYDEAVPEYRRALALGVKTPETFAGLGEALTLSTEGVSPDAMAAFDAALALDPNFQQALYYRADGYLAQGDPARALDDWTKLAALAPPGSALAQAVQRNIALAKSMAASGGADVAALPPDQRQAAIASMVAGLAQRLDAEPAQGPHDLEGWIKLVRSYGVLGEPARATAALTKAKALFSDDPVALKRLTAAATAPAPPHMP